MVRGGQGEEGRMTMNITITMRDGDLNPDPLNEMIE